MTTTTYHINDEGNAMPCTADFRCPFGSPAEHYATPQAARKAYENRSTTFDNRSYLNKKRLLANTNFAEYSGLNDEGLTDAMSDYKNSLADVGRVLRNYAAYRKTGLDEMSRRPETPEYLTPYVNVAAANLAWRDQRFDDLRKMYVEGITNYYMENVFDEEDIDVMLTDEQIESLTK